MESGEMCEFLPWDSDFFGRRIGRVVGQRLDPQRVEEILDWCRLQGIECLYFVADTDDPQTIRLAEDNGFRLVDIRVTVERRTSPLPEISLENVPQSTSIRLYKREDIPFLQAIARTAYENTRFYSDGHFPKETCARFYQTWVTNSCEGFADAVFVVEMEAQSVGFVTCHMPKKPPYGYLGLLGFAAHVRGRGFGKLLLVHALDWFAQKGVEKITAPIPGCNIPSQRLYQHLGFLTKSVHLYYHLWLSK